MSIIYIEPLIKDIKSREFDDDEASEKTDQYWYDFYLKAKDITDFIKYLGIFENMFKIALSGINNPDEFVMPDKQFNLEFHFLSQTLKECQSEKIILKDLPKFDFDKFCNFEFNVAWMIENFPKRIQEIENYRARAKQLFYNICKSNYYYAPYLKKELKEYQLLIKQHKMKRSILTIARKLKNINVTGKVTKKEIRKLEKICRLGKKEVSLLTMLSDFKPLETSILIELVPTKAHKKLKASLLRKINNYGLNIKSFSGGSFRWFYQLERKAPQI